jgi:hypothetical protein
MKRIHLYFITFLAICVISCKESKQEEIARLVNEWSEKEILFPDHSTFTRMGKDTLDFFDEKGKYCIISYVDSMGCISCKLQLLKWKEFMHETDSLVPGLVSYRFYFHPKDLKNLKFILRREAFNYSVCIDLNDEFNQLNQFPSDMTFQTFLVDSLNRVVAIGNPIHNAKVKELYLSIMTGKKRDASSLVMTTAIVDKTKADLGEFNWKEPQSVLFTLTNTGKNLLVIHDVNTSCGCITVDYNKEPVKPGSTLAIKVTYTAEHAEQINKTISLHCNMEKSPIQLQVKGNAK